MLRRSRSHVRSGRCPATTTGINGCSRLTALCAVVLALCGRPDGTLPPNIRTAGVPSIPQGLRERMERYRNSNETILQDWLTGGGMLVTTKFGETMQLHRVASPGSPWRRLTSFSEPVEGASACPDTARHVCIFSRDSAGNERFQIYLLDLDSSRARLLTDGRSNNGSAVWSNRGDRFAFVSTARNGVDWDVWVCDGRDGWRGRCVAQVNGTWTPLDWSPDDTRVLVAEFVSRTESRLQVMDPRTGALEPALPPDTVSIEGGLWNGDGSGVFYTSDAGSEFRRLRFYDRRTARETVLTGGIPWDVREVAISRDRQTLAFTTNEHGFSSVYLMDARTYGMRPLPDLPRGVIMHLRFDPPGQRLAMVVNTPQSPADVHVVDLGTNAVVRWTRSESCGLPPDSFVAPSLVEYPTFDSIAGRPRVVPCFYFRPVHGNGPFPVLVKIHGGPESQYWPYFSPDVQFLVRELGIAVLAPNVRGSGGYGRSYLMLDNGRRREGAVRDISALLTWAGRQPELDSTRIAVMGGSYGGYAALATMADYPGRVCAGISMVGITNFVTFLENTAPYRRDARRAEYGDERDSSMRLFLQEISPLTRAGRIRCPALIIHGANDPRVPLGEAEAIAQALRNNRIPVWQVTALDEGHTFQKKTNRDYQDLVVAAFLRQTLLPRRPGPGR